MRPALARAFGVERSGKLLDTLGPGGALAKLEAHAAEAAGLPCAAGDAEQLQPRGVVNAAVRAVATEWLIEVCWDWKLESTTVFLGARYLDLWLATTRVEQLSKFQGIAISCLRAAFQHSRDARGRRDLSKPAAWADVCDGAATASDVSAACRVVARLLRAHGAARVGDTPKLALRRLWYQLLEAGYMNASRVYVYMLASFLLHLSLLDAPLSRDTAPTLLATGALACSLDAYGFDPWPPCLAGRSALLRGEVDAVMERLRAAQARTQARQLRLLWSTGYNYEATPEWLFLRTLVATPTDAGGLALERGAGRRPIDGAPAAPAGAAGGDGEEGEGQQQQGEGEEGQQGEAGEEQQQQQQHAGQEQQAADADEDEEVEQPVAAPAAAAAAAPQQHEQQQQQQQQTGRQARRLPRRGGLGEAESTSNQAAVVEDGELDDSGTSRAAAAAGSAPAFGGAGQPASDEVGRRQKRRRQPAAQQQQAPARQLRQRRTRRGAGEAGPSQAVSQSGSAATGEPAAAGPSAGATAGRAAPEPFHLEQLPFAAAAEAPGPLRRSAAAAATGPVAPLQLASAFPLPISAIGAAGPACTGLGTPAPATTPLPGAGVQPQQRRYSLRDETPGLSLAHPHPEAMAAGAAARAGAAAAGGGAAGEAVGGTAAEMGLWQL